MQASHSRTALTSGRFSEGSPEFWYSDSEAPLACTTSFDVVVGELFQSGLSSTGGVSPEAAILPPTVSARAEILCAWPVNVYNDPDTCSEFEYWMKSEFNA